MELLRKYFMPCLFFVFSFIIYIIIEYYFPFVGYGVIIMRPIFFLVTIGFVYILIRVQKKWICFFITLLGNSFIMLFFLPQEGCSTFSQINEHLNSLEKFEKIENLNAFLGEGKCDFDSHVTFYKYSSFLKDKQFYALSFFRKGERQDQEPQRFLILIDSLGNVFTQRNTPLIQASKSGVNFELKSVMGNDTIEIKISPNREKFSSNCTPKIVGQIRNLTSYKDNKLTPFLHLYLRKLRRKKTALQKSEAQKELEMILFYKKKE